MDNLIKLASKFEKQAKDHHGVDPETRKGIEPKFKNGMILEYKDGRKCRFLNNSLYDKDEALVQFIDKSVGYQSYDYVKKKDLKTYDDIAWEEDNENKW